MKKSNLILPIVAMAILAIMVVFVSCKKENNNSLNTKNYTVQQAADIRQMEDPQAYMLDFKKKLTESKDNEAFDLNDAAWHLACLANLDFCNVNVEYNDFQFDTIEIQVNVTDGIILLGDLNTAYEQMCTEIQQFKRGFNHYDQNLYYINVSISADGNAKIALMTSVTTFSKYLLNHTWYFSDYYEAYLACYEYFSSDSTYLWYGLAASELQRVLNLFEHYNSMTIGPGGSLVQCYVPTRSYSFYYLNSHDPYGSPFLSDSRLFTAEGTSSTFPNLVIPLNDMCYCLDSYLGLAYDYIADNLYYDEHPVNWTINCLIYKPDDYKMYIYYHELYVEFGQLITNNPPDPQDK